MNYIASFDEFGEVVWEEIPYRGPDLMRLQKAMFMDRPDLWPSKPKGRRTATKPLNGQIAFVFFAEPLACLALGTDPRPPSTSPRQQCISFNPDP